MEVKEVGVADVAVSVGVVGGAEVGMGLGPEKSVIKPIGRCVLNRLGGRVGRGVGDGQLVRQDGLVLLLLLALVSEVVVVVEWKVLG